jgi:hypothetical protein
MWGNISVQVFGEDDYHKMVFILDLSTVLGLNVWTFWKNIHYCAHCRNAQDDHLICNHKSNVLTDKISVAESFKPTVYAYSSQMVLAKCISKFSTGLPREDIFKIRSA